jgi:hypothetical protein
VVHLIHDPSGASALAASEFPDERTFGIWADIMAESQEAGRPIVVCGGGQEWDLALVTADYRDFEYLHSLTLIPISS